MSQQSRHEPSETSGAGWAKIFLAAMLSMIVSGGATYLTMNERLIRMEERLSVLQVLAEKVITRQELVIKRVGDVEFDHRMLTMRLRSIELKFPRSPSENPGEVDP